MSKPVDKDKTLKDRLAQRPAETLAAPAAASQKTSGQKNSGQKNSGQKSSGQKSSGQGQIAPAPKDVASVSASAKSRILAAAEKSAARQTLPAGPRKGVPTNPSKPNQPFGKKPSGTNKATATPANLGERLKAREKPSRSMAPADAAVPPQNAGKARPAPPRNTKLHAADTDQADIDSARAQAARHAPVAKAKRPLDRGPQKTQKKTPPKQTPPKQTRRETPAVVLVAKQKVGELKKRSADSLQHVAERTGLGVKLGLKWFYRGLRKRTNLAAFAQDYRTLLALAHRYGFDREVERLFFVPTYGSQQLRRLTIKSPHWHAGHAYRATPKLMFDWAMALLPTDLREYQFFDIGAGRGRVLLLASHYGFNKIRGVEFAAELHDDALMNVQQFPRSRMRCRDVDCWHQDALDLDIPDEKLVFFFFDPFSEAMVQRMMSKIVSTYRAHPRSIYLIFVDPPSDDVMQRLVEESNIFKRQPFGRFRGALVHYFSPTRMRVYKSNI